MQIQEIDNLTWELPKEINVRGTKRKLKTAQPNEQFWNMWRDHKEALQKAGFSVSKWGGEWSVNWWAQDGEWHHPELDAVSVVIDEPLVLKPLVNENKIDPRFRFQIPLIQQTVAGMDRYGATLNGSGTGVGKTFITLFAALERDKRLVVICPKSIVPDWIRAGFLVGVRVDAFGWEWVKTSKTPFGHWKKEVINAGKKNERVVKGDFEWTIPDGTELVFDEVHRAAGMDTQNSHILQRAVDQKIPMSMLSATIADNPTKMRATGYALGLHRNGRSFFEWMQRHGVHEELIPVAGGRKIKIYKFRGSARHLQAIHKSIFPHKGCRVRADQLGDAFPVTQILAKAYEMDEASDIKKAYDEMMEKVNEIMYEKDMKSSEKQANILVEILRARQRVELLRVPLFVSLTRDYEEEGNSIFMAVNFKDTLKELVEQLKIKSIIVGGQRDHDRRNMIDDFQANKTNKLAGIIQACREGLNLHDIHGGHPRVALISPTPSAFDLKQVLGRVWRAGGKSPSIQRILFAAGTIEELVCENLATKLDQLDILMDGDLQKGIFPASYSDMRPKSE